jgi:thioesterase domain-containing protein
MSLYLGKASMAFRPERAQQTMEKMSYVAAATPSRSLVEEIERVWQERIPLAAQLGIQIIRLDERSLEVSAPLAANSNHMGTGFAGSLLAVASLAGWGAVVSMLERVDAAQVVVQETTASFMEPVTGDFRAHGLLPDASARERFLEAFRRRGRARATIVVEVTQAQRVVMRAESRFVAMRA